MKGYKAFETGLVCRNFKYKVGEKYTEEKAEICNCGFHFCENPLDTLNYYDLCNSEFTEIEASGDIVGHDQDTKYASTQIKITAKLDLPGFIKASIDFLFSKCKASSGDSAQLASSGYYAKLASSGDSAQLASSGYYAKLASSGDYAKLASSGYYAKLALNGKDGVGASIGPLGRIKGDIGNWITLAEWVYDRKLHRDIPVCVKSAKIDGKKLKADTYYMLIDKKFVAVD